MARTYNKKGFRRPNFKEFPTITHREYIDRCLSCVLDDCDTRNYSCNLYGYLDTGCNEITKNVEAKAIGCQKTYVGFKSNNDDESGYIGEYRIGY